MFVFPLKSDKSAKQYKLGQVLSWLLISENKPPEFSFYGQFTCEALDFSLRGRTGSEIHLLAVSELVVNSKMTTESRKE